MKALALFGFAFLAARGPTGCSTGDVKDASDAKPQFECQKDPFIFCQPVAAGAAGCVGDPGSADSFLKRLPADKAYPEGCLANFVTPDPKVEEVCGLEAVCSCTRVDDSVADASVRPDAANGDAAIADAESDATSDAESDAATPAPVPPEPTDAGPPKPARFVWSCR
jgi:hypothetical protein